MNLNFYAVFSRRASELPHLLILKKGRDTGHLLLNEAAPVSHKSTAIETTLDLLFVSMRQQVIFEMATCWFPDRPPWKALQAGEC